MRRILPLAIAFLLTAGLPSTQAQTKPPRTDIEQKAIAKVQQLGGLVLELAQNDPHLEVSYQQSDHKFTDEQLAILKDLKGPLVHLNLRRQEVTDASTVH